MVKVRDPATGRMVEVERRPIRNPGPARQGPAEADLKKARDTLAEAGGVHTFTGLYEGDRRVRARLVAGKFGLTWLTDGPDQERFGKWITAGPNSRQQQKAKLRERPELAGAVIDTEGRQIIFARTGCKWGTDAKLKFTQ